MKLDHEKFRVAADPYLLCTKLPDREIFSACTLSFTYLRSAMARDAAGSLSISNIPSIAILRERLNYGNKNAESCKRLLSSIKLFHSTFKTQDGRAANEIGWNEPNQSILNEVVKVFLDAAGNGPNFWPNDENSPNFNGLRYSNHEHKERCEHKFWFQVHV